MTTKITIDLALVREVLGFDQVLDRDFIVGEDNIFVYFDYNRSYTIDIHRFKDKAIEWCAGKGWGIEVHREELDITKGDIRVYHQLSILRICEKVLLFGDIVPRLSAELAAIDFVYKQIQKEKKDEN